MAPTEITLSLPFDVQTLIDICRQNDVSKLGLFGSMARGDATGHSDIDVLVEFSKEKSLLGLVRLERELSEALGRKVDLVTAEALSPYIRDSVEEDLRILYET